MFSIIECGGDGSYICLTNRGVVNLDTHEEMLETANENEYYTSLIVDEGSNESDVR